MRFDLCPMTRPSRLSSGPRCAATVALLAALGLATLPVAAVAAQPAPTQAQPAAAASAGQAKVTASKANVKVKPKSSGSAPGEECGATSGVKVPTWPKCPGPDKIGVKAKQAGS
ncbi:hypothetical protein [Ideonella sp. A 288]|uniref:hypothetical protein n=1 Tax=Ideonella sp. A 288 TaxID=1962181 RepID=UPI000B4B8313|nr:hypothetical protein [Ideonella sp. A 288]